MERWGTAAANLGTRSRCPLLFAGRRLTGTHQTNGETVVGRTMRRTVWPLSLAVVATGVAVTGVPSAYAASGTDTRGVVFSPSWDHLVSTSPGDGAGWRIGDCKHYGFVRISRPDSRAVATLRWEFSMFTRKTSRYDQWHQRWSFRTESGTAVLGVSPIDGPRMYRAGQFYDGAVEIAVHLTPAAFDSIARATWLGEC